MLSFAMWHMSGIHFIREFYFPMRMWYTYETWRVVITHGLGVTKGFKDRVSLYDLIFKGTLLAISSGLFSSLLGRGTNGGEVRNYLLRVFSLSGSRLTAVLQISSLVIPHQPTTFCTCFRLCKCNKYTETRKTSLLFSLFQQNFLLGLCLLQKFAENWAYNF